MQTEFHRQGGTEVDDGADGPGLALIGVDGQFGTRVVLHRPTHPAAVLLPQHTHLARTTRQAQQHAPKTSLHQHFNQILQSIIILLQTFQFEKLFTRLFKNSESCPVQTTLPHVFKTSLLK